MPRTRQIIKFSKSDQRFLTRILTKKETSAREQTRARVLDLLRRAEPPERIAAVLGVGLATVYNLQKRFLKEGLAAALSDKPRSGKPPVIQPEEKARITALACSAAPPGYARWTLRLLADQAVELGYVESISHTEVGRILKKTRSSRINKSNGVLGKSRVNI